MIQNRISYQGILETFGCDGDINGTLRHIAELHQDHCMRGLHRLANDNAFLGHNKKNLKSKSKKKTENKKFNMPKVYKLFGFVPCPTTLDAIWARKNYNEHNQIN